MTRPWNQLDSTRTLIKICGIRDEATLACAVDAGADAVGFVLAPGSPRTIDVNDAIRLAEGLPDHVTAVGVVVDAESETHAAWSGRWLQLHGQETEAIAAEYDGPIIRAMPFDPEALNRWDRCAFVDRLLVDAPQPGSGRAFDHAAFAEIDEPPSTPIIVAGGLDPQTVGEAIERLRPWAVDVSSGVESEPGIKDPGMIMDFCRAVRKADGS